MKKLIFLFLVMSFSAIQAQRVRVTQTDKTIINHIFNGNWQTADSLIDIEAAAKPADLKFPFMKGYAAFYSRVFSSIGLSRAATVTHVKHYMWEAIQLGESIEQNTETKFYLGAAYALLSRVNIMERDFWNAYWNAGESENYFEDIIEDDPDMADAYLNIGITEYFADFAVTGFRSVLAWLGGMSGNREKGLEYIKRTAESGVLFADEAKFALAIISSAGENDYTSASNYWNELHNKFPNSTPTETAYYRALLIEKVIKNGSAFLNNEIDSLLTKYHIDNSFALNAIGYIMLNQQKYEDALNIFQINIQLYPDVANCYDSLAECYMTMGDNQKAVKFYKTAYYKLDDDESISENFRNIARERIAAQLDDLGAPLET